MKGFASPPAVGIAIKKKDGSFGTPAGTTTARGLALVPTRAEDWLLENGVLTVRPARPGDRRGG